MKRLPVITLVYGEAMFILGVVAYIWLSTPGAKSVTALIPAFIGIPVAILGGLALLKPAPRKHLMHGTVLLGLLSVAGTFPGLLKIGTWISAREELERANAVLVQSIACLMSLCFVAICIASFRAARAEREMGSGDN